MDDEASHSIDEQAWNALLETIVASGPLDPSFADLYSNDSDHPEQASVPRRRSHADPDIPAFHEPPGVALVTTLASTRPKCMTSTQGIEFIQATEAAIAWLGAMQAEAIVAVAGPRARVVEYHLSGGRQTSIEDASRSELAAATSWSESWTHDRITTARLLDGPLPQTRAALASGAISLRQADAIAAAVSRFGGFSDWITDTASEAAAAAFTRSCALLEEAVVPLAVDSGLTATRRASDRAVNRIDADNAARRRKQERRSRDVTVYEEADGIAVLVARLASEQAHACLSAIDRLARDPLLPLSAGTAADAGIGERRAEALVQLVLRDPGDRDPASIRTHVEVVIDLATLLGIAESEGSLRGGGPGGPVPIAAEVVRQLIADDPSASMRRLVTDPLTGHLLDRGRSTYQVPDRLRDFITSRDSTCRFPGCNRRAGLTQIDHAVPWDKGGATDRSNLGALCVRHHLIKTHCGWQIAQSRDDGSCRWRSPTGVTYEHPATSVIARPPPP